jgi:probable phosphoglycerate mutase
MTTIVAVRHGETTWNREKRMQGWAPTPLTELGREQALAVGEALAAAYDIDRVHASDLHRTRETAELVGEHVPAPVTYEPAWRERDIGVYQGLPYEEMFERFPEYGLGETGAMAASKRPDSGESLVDVRERVVEGWESLLAESDPEETVLVVAHGGPIRLMLGHVKDLEVHEAVLEQSQHNCSINEFAHDHASGETRVVRENATDHL